MTKNLIIMALIVLVIYLYYQPKQKPNLLNSENKGTDPQILTFLNSNSLEELKTKLGEKTLDELIEENEDYETEVDTLTRTKESLEADLLAQSNAFQSRLREKESEIKRLKETLENEKKRADKAQKELTSEKQQHKGSIERIAKLTEQITKLEKALQNEQQKVELLRRKRDKEDKK